MDRLNAYNVSDDLIRAELYKEIRDGAENKADGWIEYEIQPDERLHPELVSYRFYGTDALKWVVLIVSGLDDMREGLPVGESIFLPPIAHVRKRIKHYSETTYE